MVVRMAEHKNGGTSVTRRLSRTDRQISTHAQRRGERIHYTAHMKGDSGVILPPRGTQQSQEPTGVQNFGVGEKRAWSGGDGIARKMGIVRYKRASKRHIKATTNCRREASTSKKHPGGARPPMQLMWRAAQGKGSAVKKR